MEQEFVSLERVHVACDTEVMWQIFKNNAPWLADFEQMARSGVAFSLADHAFAEIVNQLDQGEFTDAQYVAGTTGMARLIDLDFPVLPGKRQLLEWCSDTPDEEQLSEDRLRDVLELDELWSFVGSKTNARWVWIALCRQTRQVVAYFVGDRSAESARALRERLPAAYRCRATRSDQWLADDETFPRRTHRSCGKEEGETCRVERWNGTLRQRLGRFVRETLSFSKCECMHELALRLFVHEYNQQPITY